MAEIHGDHRRSARLRARHDSRAAQTARDPKRARDFPRRPCTDERRQQDDDDHFSRHRFDEPVQVPGPADCRKSVDEMEAGCD